MKCLSPHPSAFFLFFISHIPDIFSDSMVILLRPSGPPQAPAELEAEHEDSLAPAQAAAFLIQRIYIYILTSEAICFPFDSLTLTLIAC